MANWSLSRKIWSIVIGLSVVFVMCTVMGLRNLSLLRDSLNEVTSTIVRRDQLTSEIKDNQRRIVMNAMESIVFTKTEQFKANEKEFADLMAKQDKDLQEFRGIASEKGKEILDHYLTIYEKFMDGVRKTREFGLQNKNDEAGTIYVDIRENLLPLMRKDINALNDLTAKNLAERSANANADAQRAIIVDSVVVTCSILMSLLVSFFILRALTRAIADIVKGLHDSSTQVSAASSQIASASEELSQASSEQAASLEETAASVEEMNSMVAKNSDNAASAASSSAASEQKALNGKTTVDKMSQRMQAIDASNTAIMNQINESNAAMAEIVSVIEQIDKKTRVINDIVNKTELLSFNASVEAARAGEHGKGFAVVAEEVGNLARMSGAAAEEIGSMLEQSIAKVNQVVNETKSSVERLIAEGKKTIEQGAEVARECGEVFEGVVHDVTSVSGMASEISSASQEQSRGCAEITKAMAQLDEMTQQNATTSEECASAAEELSAQAEMLKGAVARLVRTVNGSQSGSADLAPETPVSAPRVAASTTQRGKVLRLKTNRSRAANDSAAAPMKRAAGDVPAYESEGFGEI